MLCEDRGLGDAFVATAATANAEVLLFEAMVTVAGDEEVEADVFWAVDKGEAISNDCDVDDGGGVACGLLPCGNAPLETWTQTVG